MNPRTLLLMAALSAATVAKEADAASVVSPTGKGITGCALLGSEAVMLTEGLIGVKPWWAYAIGGGVGAIGGGIGGYYTEGGDAKLPFYLFMGGMALVIPTTIVVLDATKWQPVNYTEDQPPPDEPVAEPAAPEPAPGEPHSEAEHPRAARRAAHSRPGTPRARGRSEAFSALPPALVGIDQGTLSLSVPAVEVRHVYTRTEIATLGVKQASLVSVPLLNVVF